MDTTPFPREDVNILLLEGISQTAVDTFTGAGYTSVDHRDTALSTDELKHAIADAHFIGIRSRTQLTADVLDHAQRLMAVGCFCIGTNQVDLDSAETRGIPVFNAPYSNTRSVAELVMAEIIFLFRGIPEKVAACHRGGWAKTAKGSYEVRGKVLGIVGYGHIGTQIGVIAEALGMEVIYYDIEPKLAMGNARRADSLSDLLARSDVVTLHVPETPRTRMMIGERELAKMRPGSRLINASRGTVVDIDALAEALRSEHLSGAAIDVFPVEPSSNKGRFESPLVGMDNVILTPHIGGSTFEAQQNIGVEVASKLIRYSDNGSTLSAVNFPEVSLPEHAQSRRLLHIHRNVPGVMSAINEQISHAGVNVNAQYLQTRGELGYVVIDVDASEGDPEGLRDQLDKVQGTLRTRLLY